MRLEDTMKTRFVMFTIALIVIVFVEYRFLPQLVPETKTVHHEYTVKKSYIETDQSIFGTWRDYYLVTDHGTFKVSDKEYYDSSVSGKYKFDEEVEVNGKR